MNKGDRKVIDGLVWECTDPDIDRWVSIEHDESTLDTEMRKLVEHASDQQGNDFYDGPREKVGNNKPTYRKLVERLKAKRARKARRANRK
jgi:hypothetical protein